MPMPVISIVIPTLNEAISIGSCIDKAHNALQCLHIPYEIIISDSHSTDATVAIAQNKGAHIVYQPLLGYGNAYHKGLAATQGEIIVIGDADNTYDFGDIPKFIQPLLENQADLVIGNRLNATIEKGAMPWTHRYIGTPFMTATLNMLFKTTIKDSNCGLRAFRKAHYEKLQLKSPGWEYATEMLIQAGKQNLRILNIDITLHCDMYGRKPHLTPWSAAAYSFILLLKKYFSNN